MISKNNITEQDIFNYIFYPDVLATDKKYFLDNHKNDYIEQIEFCIALNQSENLKNVNDFITTPQKFSMIELYPVNLKIGYGTDYLTLAAASSELNKRIETKTFTDEKSQFLVRLVAAEGEKKLYIFSKRKEFKEAKLTLFPSLKSFTISSFELPIKIDNFEEIEKISIEDFN